MSAVCRGGGTGRRRSMGKSIIVRLPGEVGCMGRKAWIAAILFAMSSLASAADFPFLVGVAKEDITGPPVGVQMLGFVRSDQITEGIHLRQWARAFAIADPKTDHRVVFVVLDLAFVSHSLKQAALDLVQE